MHSSKIIIINHQSSIAISRMTFRLATEPSAGEAFAVIASWPIDESNASPTGLFPWGV
jgi:hypothetical protein